MSIAIDEAESYARHRYSGSTHIEHRDGRAEVVPSHELQIVYRKQGYIAGRTSLPTEAEIEAAAITAVDTLHGVYPDSMPCWEDSNEDTQSRAKQYAVYMLDAARKAVTE
jgi:hypothetical protein